MNFLLPKSISINYLFSLLFFLGLLIGFFRCVPIEDLVEPTVGEFTLQEQYNVSDSIILTAILADNFGISKYTIDIEAVNGEGLWSYTSTDSVKARLLNLKDTIIIPSENFAIGKYTLTLTAFDASGKSKISTKSFLVGKDASNPTFPTFDVLLPTLEPFTDGNYPACSSQKVPLAGVARDNIGLELITARFENYSNPYVIRRFTDKRRSVDLSTVFDNNLTFPANLSSNTELILILKATDTEGNADSVKIPFKINCDDKKPEIKEIKTNLDANRNEEGAIKVIQGQKFFIISGLITDNEELNKVFVYLDNINENTTDTFITEPINGRSFNLNSLDNNRLIIPIPPIPTTGKNSYKLRIDATDAAGNRSNMYEQKLEIIINDPPAPTVTYLKDGRNEYSNLSPLNINNPLAVLAGSVVTVRFKIVEDVALSSYKLVWKKENSDLPPFTITEKNEAITDFNPEVTFKVADNAEGIYVLTLYAKDTFDANPIVEVKYYFIVR